MPAGNRFLHVQHAERNMARLRHFAIVVGDLEKSAKFYEDVFALKRVGQEKLDFAAAVYLSDGVINLALLNYFGSRGSGLQDAKNFVGAHHFGFQVEDAEEIAKRLGKWKVVGPEKRPADRVYAEQRATDPEGNNFDIAEGGFDREAAERKKARNAVDA